MMLFNNILNFELRKTIFINHYKTLRYVHPVAVFEWGRVEFFKISPNFLDESVINYIFIKS